MPKKEVAIKHSTILFTYILVVWGIYRFLFQLPQEIEELLVKPIIWLIPIFILLRREKSKPATIGITSKNFFQAIYFALSLGAFFAIEGVIVNYLKYGHLDFSANIGTKNILLSLIISFATAISEEIVFRGYLFSRLSKVFKSEWVVNFVVTIGWVLVNIPVVVFVWQLPLPAALIYLALASAFSLGAGFVYARSGNIASPIFLRVFWEWPIILFR